MKRYVVGFAFDRGVAPYYVALIRKSKPAWQQGKLNGVGGEINPGEPASVAMEREWVEETGVGSPVWRQFAVLNFQESQVIFFSATLNAACTYFRTDTNEPVQWYKMVELSNQQMVYNLRWLIPLALDPDQAVNLVINYSAPNCAN